MPSPYFNSSIFSPRSRNRTINPGIDRQLFYQLPGDEGPVPSISLSPRHLRLPPSIGCIDPIQPAHVPPVLTLTAADRALHHGFIHSPIHTDYDKRETPPAAIHLQHSSLLHDIELLLLFLFFILNPFVLFSFSSPCCSNAPPSECLDGIFALRPTESESPQPLILTVTRF